MSTSPKIHATKVIAKTRIFCVEEMELEFSNGTHRTYERLKAGVQGAVMIIPVDKNNNLLLIREYAAGTERYELAFPKGLIEKGETPKEAANRELKEEVGMGATTLTTLKPMTLAPGYLSHKMYLILARDLYKEKLVGDEPEEIEVIPWPLANKKALLAREDFTEARSIAALYMVSELLDPGRQSGT